MWYRWKNKGWSNEHHLWARGRSPVEEIVCDNGMWKNVILSKLGLKKWWESEFWLKGKGYKDNYCVSLPSIHALLSWYQCLSCLWGIFYSSCFRCCWYQSLHWWVWEGQNDSGAARVNFQSFHWNTLESHFLSIWLPCWWRWTQPADITQRKSLLENKANTEKQEEGNEERWLCWIIVCESATIQPWIPWTFQL